MIIRVFRAIVRPGKHAEYEMLLQETAIPFMNAQHGMVSLLVGKPRSESPDEYVMISTWLDIAAIRAFAGDNWLESKVLPGEAELVIETFVHHYESI